MSSYYSASSLSIMTIVARYLFLPPVERGRYDPNKTMTAKNSGSLPISLRVRKIYGRFCVGPHQGYSVLQKGTEAKIHEAYNFDEVSGIILRVLRLEFSEYNVHITNQF
jgi:hypothetical protein